MIGDEKIVGGVIGPIAHNLAGRARETMTTTTTGVTGLLPVREEKSGGGFQVKLLLFSHLVSGVMKPFALPSSSLSSSSRSVRDHVEAVGEKDVEELLEGYLK